MPRVVTEWFIMEHAPIFLSPISNSVFLHTPRLSGSIQLNWSFRLKTEQVYERSGHAQHLETAAARAAGSDRNRPSRPVSWILITYRDVRHWLDESSQINESDSPEVFWIYFISHGHSRQVYKERYINIHEISSRHSRIPTFTTRPPFFNVWAAHLQPKGHRRVFELGICMYNLME